MKNFALISQLAISLITPIFVGLWIGGKIDKILKLNGVFTLILIILGIISGFLNAYKLIMETNKDKKQEKRDIDNER